MFSFKVVESVKKERVKESLTTIRVGESIMIPKNFVEGLGTNYGIDFVKDENGKIALILTDITKHPFLISSRHLKSKSVEEREVFKSVSETSVNALRDAFGISEGVFHIELGEFVGELNEILEQSFPDKKDRKISVVTDNKKPVLRKEGKVYSVRVV